MNTRTLFLASFLAPSLAPFLAAPAVAQFAPGESIAPAVNNAVAITAADFDGDGDVDVAVAARGGGRILLFERIGPLSSAMSFASQRRLGGPWTDLTDLCAVDLDADGDVDLVAAAGASVVWLSNDGTGQFDPVTELAALPGSAGRLEIVDRDGDGDLDIAAAGADLVLLDGLGAGAFAPAVALAGSALPAADLVVFDADGDGDLDTAAVTADQIVWLRNDGALPLAGPFVLDSGVSDATDLDAADLFGSGVDLVVTVRGSSDLFRYESLGSGAFGPRTTLASSAGQPTESDFGDFDGDGDLDLAVAGGSDLGPLWYVNTGASQFTGPFFLTIDSVGMATNVLVTDLDADGNPDVLASTSRDALYAYVGLGSAGSGVFFEDPVDLTQRATGAADVSAVDMDGDGDLDAVVALRLGMRLVWYENVDGAWPGLAHVIDDGARFNIARAADLDGDGNVDVIATTVTDSVVRQYMGLGGGQFSGPTVLDTFPASSGAIDFEFGDADADGDLDLFAVRNPQYLFVYYVNDGMGNLGPRVTIDANPPGVSDIELGDFDDDGNLDVALAQAIFNSIVFYRGLGTAGFEPGVSFENGAQAAFDDLEVVDIDGDGDQDLVWQTSFANQIAWLEKLGPGTFAPRQMLSDQVGSGLELEVFDVDRDGDMDLVSISRDPNRIEWMANDGSMTFSAPTLIASTEFQARQLRVADIDGDADGDLLVTLLSEGQVLYFENQTLGKFGDEACAGEPNSTGGAANLCVVGSDVLAMNQATLSVTGLPLGSSGYFLASTDAAFVVGAGGSLGTLCLGGSIGRYVGPGQVQNSGVTGTFALDLDLTMIPQPTSFVAAMAGETWRFQGWYRDSIGGQAVSNFTSASAATFQ